MNCQSSVTSAKASMRFWSMVNQSDVPKCCPSRALSWANVMVDMLQILVEQVAGCVGLHATRKRQNRPRKIGPAAPAQKLQCAGDVFGAAHTAQRHTLGRFGTPLFRGQRKGRHF